MEVERLIVEQHALETTLATSYLFQGTKTKTKKTKYEMHFILFILSFVFRSTFIFLFFVISGFTSSLHFILSSRFTLPFQLCLITYYFCPFFFFLHLSVSYLYLPFVCPFFPTTSPNLLLVYFLPYSLPS